MKNQKIVRLIILEESNNNHIDKLIHKKEYKNCSEYINNLIKKDIEK